MNKLQLNIYLKRNNRACMVFKRNGILYRINNLTKPRDFVWQMKDLSKVVNAGTKTVVYLELYDHHHKCWVLECEMLEGKVQLAVWFQNKTELKHFDARFSWQGSTAEFMRAVDALNAAVDVQWFFGLRRKG